MKVVLLIDEWAHRKFGGLTQVQRILLNIAEWQGPASPSLLIYEKTDLTSKVVNYLKGETEPVLILKTSLLLSRKALPRLIESLSVLPQELTDRSWEGLFQIFDQCVSEKPDENSNDGVFWDVMNQDSDLSTLKKRLFNSLRKPTDGLVSRYLNRPISLFISRFLVDCPMTPNQYTVVVFLLSPLFFLILSTGTWWGFVLGTVLFHLANVLDGCDGEIARLKFLNSKLGEKADTVVDQVCNHLFVLALGIGLSRQPGLTETAAAFYLWEGILSTSLMLLMVLALAKIARQEDGKYNFSDFGKTFTEELQGRTMVKKGIFFLTQLLRRDTYAFLFIFFPLFGKPEWVLHFLCLGVLAYIIILTVKVVNGKRTFEEAALTDS